MAKILTFAPEKQQNLQELKDEEVILKVLEGEKDLYEILMRRYNRRLYRIGRSYLGNYDEDVIDTIQDAYIRAYENLRGFRNESKFSTWLTRIFINSCLAKISYKKRFASNSSEVINADFNPKQFTSMDPEKNIINKELGEVLEKAIDRLPEKYKTVYIMRDIEEMSIAETSECLNISEANVKVRLNRAKEMLRSNINSMYKDAELFQFDGVRCDRIVKFVLGKIVNLVN